jgi:hypothetical protein
LKLKREGSSVQNFALVFGIIYIVVGLLGFVPALVSPPEPTYPLVIEANHGRLFGLFPINLLHNLVHLGIGIWGVIASRSASEAVVFARGVAVLYVALTILGLIPATNTLFGLAPIYGYDIWLHATSAIVAVYFEVVRTPESS